MLRWVLFAAVLSGGTVIFQSMELLSTDEAWLVSGVIAVVAVFAIPSERNRRRPKDLIIFLVAVVGLYGIHLKFRPWLANVIDRRVAMGVSILLLLVFIGALFVPNMIRETKSEESNDR